MQLNDGQVTVTKGSTTIVGVGVNWSSIARSGTTVTQPVLFQVRGHTAQYRVVTMSVANDQWSATLETPYAEGANTVPVTANYIMVVDFTANYSLPLLNTGDVETASLVSRSLRIVDAALQTALNNNGSTGTGELLANQSGHNFVIGSVVCLLDSGGSAIWALATTYDDARSNVVGVVSWVGVDSDAASFKLKFSGEVSPITLASPALTQAGTYALTSTASPSVVNVVPIASVTAGARLIPVWIAKDTSTVVLLGFAASRNGTMQPATALAAGLGGAVPAPLAGDQDKALFGGTSGGSHWRLPTTQVSSLQVRHLDNNGTWSDTYWGSLINYPGAAITKALESLYTLIGQARASATYGSGYQIAEGGFLAEAEQASTIIGKHYYWSAGTGNHPLTLVPSPRPYRTIHEVFNHSQPMHLRVKLLGGGGGGGFYYMDAGSYFRGGGGGGGETLSFDMILPPGWSLKIEIGRGGITGFAGRSGGVISSIYENGWPTRLFVSDGTNTYGLAYAAGGQGGSTHVAGISALGGSESSQTGHYWNSEDGGTFLVHSTKESRPGSNGYAGQFFTGSTPVYSPPGLAAIGLQHGIPAVREAQELTSVMIPDSAVHYGNGGWGGWGNRDGLASAVTEPLIEFAYEAFYRPQFNGNPGYAIIKW